MNPEKQPKRRITIGKTIALVAIIAGSMGVGVNIASEKNSQSRAFARQEIIEELERTAARAYEAANRDSPNANETRLGLLFSDSLRIAANYLRGDAAVTRDSLEARTNYEKLVYGKK